MILVTASLSVRMGNQASEGESHDRRSIRRSRRDGP